MENTLLWIVAFLGVAIIYTSRPILRLFGADEPSESNVVIAKSVGIFISAISLLILYMTGRLG